MFTQPDDAPVREHLFHRCRWIAMLLHACGFPFLFAAFGRFEMAFLDLDIEQ